MKNFQKKFLISVCCLVLLSAINDLKAQDSTRRSNSFDTLHSQYQPPMPAQQAAPQIPSQTTPVFQQATPQGIKTIPTTPNGQTSIPSDTMPHSFNKK